MSTKCVDIVYRKAHDTYMNSTKNSDTELLEGHDAFSFLRLCRRLNAQSLDLDAEAITGIEQAQLNLGIKMFGIKKVRG